MTRTFDQTAFEAAVTTIKTLSMDGVEKANSGHPGTPMGLSDIAFELWANHLRHDPKDPTWIGRDRFVLSCGHASMLLYSLLHLFDYGLSIEDLKNFRQWGSKTPGHPEVFHTAGVEITTGPLGSGVSSAVGFALAEKMKEARFGAPFAHNHVYVICSDGDVQEGISAEAASLAGHWGLDNLTVIWDDNRITIEGTTDLATSEDVGARYEAQGWSVVRIDGHNRGEIAKALDKANRTKGRPTFVVARTHIANGAPHAHDTSEAHGAPLGKAEIAATKTALGVDPALDFYVPEVVRVAVAARVAELHGERQAWDANYAVWRAGDAAKAAALASLLGRVIPDDLLSQLIEAIPAKEDATRNLSNAIEQKVAALLPSLIGGSADLGPSTKTLIKNGGSIGVGSYEGRNLFFGIREHGMGAIVNGLALAGGFIPFGSTFLVFSDYMRGSIRLSAVMGLQTLWIYTHDSVWLGEDGPTHQPIEHLWALRLIPNLHVVRPADALETAAAWTMAIQRKHGPTAFALSRQKVPNLVRPSGFVPADMLKGAYVVYEPASEERMTLPSFPALPDVILVATGSEVGVAVEAAKALAAEGKQVRVVSALCLEVFDEQDAAYKESILPHGVKLAAFEAGRTGPWRAIVGRDGLVIGVDHFGASAPDKVLAEKFGLTAPQVADKLRAYIG
jgi:transketolase